MSTDSGSSKLWMVAAGAFAIVGAAVVYHLATAPASEEEEKETDELKADLAKLGEVEKEASG